MQLFLNFNYFKQYNPILNKEILINALNRLYYYVYLYIRRSDASTNSHSFSKQILRLSILGFILNYCYNSLHSIF